MRAVRPPASGETTSIAHSGRSRSSGSVITSPTSRRSSASSAGPRARTWRSREKSVSSTHLGSPGGAVASRCRSLGTAWIRCERWSRNSSTPCSPSNTISLQVCPRTLPDSSARIRASSALSRSSVTVRSMSLRSGLGASPTDLHRRSVALMVPRDELQRLPPSSLRDPSVVSRSLASAPASPESSSAMVRSYAFRASPSSPIASAALPYQHQFHGCSGAMVA